MKYCPYCGATLMGGAASFCAECGKAMTPAAKTKPPTQEPPVRRHPDVERKPPAPAGKMRPPANRNPARPVPQPNNPGRTRPTPKRSVKKQPTQSHKPKPDPRDEGYDGYYNDVKPIDNGHTRDRMDSELVKRIIFLSIGAFIVVIFSIMLMYLL